MTRPSWDETWLSLAIVVAQRSLCSRDRVGAVVVSASNRIIDTGYNGPPAGFSAHEVDYRPLPLTADTSCSQWCPRAMTPRQLGIPSGVSVSRSPTYDDCPSIHAEANALLFSDRTQREGGTIYVSSGTCSGCAKLVANSGLARAVYTRSETLHRDSDRWYDFMRDCGLRVDVI